MSLKRQELHFKQSTKLSIKPKLLTTVKRRFIDNFKFKPFVSKTNKTLRRKTIAVEPDREFVRAPEDEKSEGEYVGEFVREPEEEEEEDKNLRIYKG